MRPSRPQRYDGREDAQALDEFITGLWTYLRFDTEIEEQRVLLASRFLEGKARQWWFYLCNGHERPSGIDDIASVVQALLGRFMPRSARRQALGELRKLNKKLPIDLYTDKYQSPVQKSHNVNPERQYEWFIAGLTPGERQSVTAWAAYRQLKAEMVGVDTMVQLLRIEERRNATATALADKDELVGGGNADLEPTDVEAVAAQNRHATQGRQRRGDNTRDHSRPATKRPTRADMLVLRQSGAHD